MYTFIVLVMFFYKFNSGKKVINMLDEKIKNIIYITEKVHGLHNDLTVLPERMRV